MTRIFFFQATIFKICLVDNIIGDANGEINFIVEIDFVGYFKLQIRRNESFPLVHFKDNDGGQILDYYSGGACHFIAKRRDVLKFLEKEPLKFGIFREDETFPVCQGVAPFTGCLCDFVSKSIEEPTPFIFRGIFNLTDPGGNLAGQISLEIYLLDFGRHVSTSFVLDDGYFVLKNNPKGVEYSCVSEKNVSSFEKKQLFTSTNGPRENLMCDVAAISLAAKSLSRGKPEVTKIEQSSKDDKQGELKSAKIGKKKKKKKKKKKSGKTKSKEDKTKKKKKKKNKKQ